MHILYPCFFILHGCKRKKYFIKKIWNNITRLCTHACMKTQKHNNLLLITDVVLPQFRQVL